MPSAARRIDILGCGVDRVDFDEALASIRAMLESNQAAQVVTLGVEMVMHAQRDPHYRDVINAADLIVPDTVGIVWASQRLGEPLKERVAGIDMVERLLGSTDVPVYFLGAADGVAGEAAEALSNRHAGLRLAGTHHGYFGDAESAAIAGAIRASGARLVLVALGFPRQEFWIRENLEKLGPTVCIGVGGAFDVWAGKVKRAPAALRRFGLEWLYRLVTEPRRIGRQLALPAFAARVTIDSIVRPSAVSR